MIGGCFASLVNGLTFPIFSVIFGEILFGRTELFNPFADPAMLLESLKLPTGLFVAIGAGAFFMSFVSIASVGTAGEMVGRRVKDEYFKAVVRQVLIATMSSYRTGNDFF
jgi:hypothetical protein